VKEGEGEKEWVLLLLLLSRVGGVGENDDVEAFLAARACSGVPYFLGLPLFLLAGSSWEETAEEATEWG